LAKRNDAQLIAMKNFLPPLVTLSAEEPIAASGWYFKGGWIAGLMERGAPNSAIHSSLHPFIPR
jgi:hypothetical protein